MILILLFDLPVGCFLKDEFEDSTDGHHDAKKLKNDIFKPPLIPSEAVTVNVITGTG